MSTLDRYILAEWLKVFGVSLFVLIGLLVLQDAADHAEDFRQGFAGSGEVAAYYAWLVPSYLPWLLPIALFISTLFVVATLRRNNEIPVLRACGVNVLRLSRSLLVTAVLLSALSYGLNAKWSPLAMEKAQGLLEVLRGKLDHRNFISNFEMSPPKTSRRWFFREFFPYTSSGTGVHLYSRTTGGRDSFRIRAEKAFREEDGSWRFLNGRFIGFAGPRGLPVPSQSGEGLVWEVEFSQPVFATDDLSSVPILNKQFSSLRLPDVREDPDPFLLMRKKPSELSVRELKAIVTASGGTEGNAAIRPYAIRIGHAFWASPGCLLAVALAIPFALVGDGRSAAAGVARALGLFVGYYVARTMGDSLGEAGIIPIEWAAGVPFLLLGIVAVCFLWRVR
jgi:lipopolysaccharide export LptBFGC system permease protein LptF